MYWSVPKFPQFKNKDRKHIKAVVKFALQQERVGWKTAGIWLLFLVNFLVFLTVWNQWIGPLLFGSRVEALSITAGLLCGVIYFVHLLWYINRVVYPAVHKHEGEYQGSGTN